MQNVSNAYEESMKSTNRNRGYIRATVGIINSEAQKNIVVDKTTKTTAFSNLTAPFGGDETKIYATCEKSLSRLDSSLFFMPRSGSDYYNNGIVTQDIQGSVLFKFGGTEPLTIKGLTVDFGWCYPTEFDIETDSGTRHYRNVEQTWTTEDVFTNVTYIKIIPTKMRYTYDRLRIYAFKCGLAKIFTNEEVASYASKDYVSSIAETIPSMDVTLKVDNQSGYYDPDNPNSAIQYMEIGQELKVQFGYDVDGQGNIEWLPEQTTYLSKWSADSREATFNATDRFVFLSETYYKGKVYDNGISAYDLAVLVLTDAGLSKDEYYIDSALKNITVHNPLPSVTHGECLQIIANLCRCTLSVDRQNRIHIQSAYKPDIIITSNGALTTSDVNNLLNDEDGTLTAKQYARLRLTAKRYDECGPTAYQYAAQGKFLLK
nr:MAG TPA: hypothetical protein [Caudoviricetes sp.]